MNAKTFAKEYTTLVVANAVLRLSSFATRSATTHIKEATRLLKDANDSENDKRAGKHLKKGFVLAKNGRILREVAFSIHAPSTN
jgi:F0F1-type ATP synthase epsilon subunit